MDNCWVTNLSFYHRNYRRREVLGEFRFAEIEHGLQLSTLVDRRR